MDSHFLPLQTSQVQQPRATINRAHILFHSLSILALIYYRLSSLYEGVEPNSLIPWLVITASELLLSFLWVLSQAFRWRPVIHSVFLDRLPCDELLPAIDVFICTADPNKEPPLDVMNTVISAMCLDYPPEKLSVYLSDDAGAPITLFALRESFQFAKSWVPFCKRYGIMTICPEAYFSQPVDDGNDVKFMEKRDEIKLKYNIFKQSLEKAKGSGESYSFSQDRPPFIEVIRGSECDFVMPLLVYVSREKRPSHPHHFKAGALNSLLRVSGVISNAPFVLALDCDMYCNDPTSARQAMCFHLDPQVSPSLAFVQFPQAFHNMSNNDIYNGLLYLAFKVLWHGMNGLKGPILSGTGFYLKRQALFRTPNKKDLEIFPTKPFSPSDEFLASLHPNDRIHGISSEEQTGLLTSCTYEKDTQWGEEIGFMYHSVVEDYFTGFRLHCKGWNSIYRYPSRPAFLGSVTTNLNDTLVQTSRWMSGLLQVGLSRFCPLIYGPSRMCLLQSMCYAYLALLPLSSIAFLCYAFVPQIFLLYGIPLYPKVSNSWFAVFLIVYLSSNLQYMLDVLTTGGSFKLWWNQNRISMVRTVTSYLYACLDIVMKLVGTKEIKFIPTNKVSNEMKETRYNFDVFDFQDASIFLLPLTTIVNLNIASLLIGISRAVNRSTWEEMFGQILISLILVITGFPIIDGMIIRKDSGRIPISVTLLSVSLVTIVASASFCY